MCGSGRAREAGGAVDGTGCAGVRGRGRSHRYGAGLKVLEQSCRLYRRGASLVSDAIIVGAGVPAKQATRWMAPAAPVFAGLPASTGVEQAIGF